MSQLTNKMVYHQNNPESREVGIAHDTKPFLLIATGSAWVGAVPERSFIRRAKNYAGGTSEVPE